MPLTLEQELAQIDQIKGATFEQVLQNQELQKLEPFANYGLLKDVLRQQQDISGIDPSRMTSLNGVMTSEKEMLQNRLTQTFIPQAQRDFEDVKNKYLEGLAIRSGTAGEAASMGYGGAFAPTQPAQQVTQPATQPTAQPANPALQTGVGVFQANQQAQTAPPAQPGQQTGVGVYKSNQAGATPGATPGGDANLQQTVEQQAQTLGNNSKANKEYVNALFKAYHGRDANAQELAQYTKMGVQDSLNAIKGGSPANQANQPTPAENNTTKVETDANNIATAVTTQNIMGGDKPLIDVVKEMSQAMGLTSINEEIQKIDDQYAEDVMDINNNPWLSEALRSKKITNLQAKYDAKKDALVDRLALESDIVSKAVDYYQAERSYKQQMLFKQLDLQEKALDREQLAFKDERDYNLDLVQEGISEVNDEKQLKQLEEAGYTIYEIDGKIYAKEPGEQWSDPYNLGGDLVQKNMKTGEIRTAVNIPKGGGGGDDDKEIPAVNLYSGIMQSAINSGAKTADEIVAGVQAYAENSGVSLSVKELNAIKNYASELLKVSETVKKTNQVNKTPKVPGYNFSSSIDSIYKTLFK